MNEKEFDELFTKKYTDNKSIAIRDFGEVGPVTSLEAFLDELSILNDNYRLDAGFIGVVM